MDRGDDSGFPAFVRARSAELLATAYLLTGDQVYAENLVGTALIRAHLTGAPFRDSSSIVVSVRKILVTTMLSRWWALLWRRSRPGLEEPPARTVRPPVDEAAERDRLWDGIQGLPLEQRLLVVSRYYDGLTDTETAEITASTLEAVRSLTRQVVETLRAQSDVGQRAANWRDALEDAVRQEGAAAEPVDRVSRLLRDMCAERAAEVELPADWDERTLRRAKLVRRSRFVVPVAAVTVVLATVVGATGLVGPGMGTPEEPPGEPTATQTADVDPLRAALERLPVGPPPRVPYVAGRTIVLGPGRTVELPDELREPGRNGLGGTRDGILVVPLSSGERGTVPLHVGSDGNITAVDTEPGWYGGHAISPDGRYAAWTTRANRYGGPALAKIADLTTGKVIASRELPESLFLPSNDASAPRIHDFNGTEVLVAG